MGGKSANEKKSQALERLTLRLENLSQRREIALSLWTQFRSCYLN
uniref:Uncharacterized protein n=1 Tax=Myoviridae sp. ct9dX1 TaxID=2827665 RepID=A0A8S5TJU9_9CAUD|nr:MAG TPA: hypothetical protein [Myoviridae sp. ct9dX1]